MSGWSRMRLTVSCVPCTMLSTPRGIPAGTGEPWARNVSNRQAAWQPTCSAGHGPVQTNLCAQAQR